MSTAMIWFEELTGIDERLGAEHIRRNIEIEGEWMRSLANGRSFRHGRLETPTLADLRERVRAIGLRGTPNTVRELVGDVRILHGDPANAGALFQAASQFNLLEMTGFEVTPEEGIGIYEGDRTQGPACAIAAGGGTIYRNYFVEVNGRVGQTHDNQIDCLREIGEFFGNEGELLWKMRNGYALATETGLREIGKRLRNMNDEERDSIRSMLRIGLQFNAEVTLRGGGHLVSQAYCSALPVGYSSHRSELWENFAVLVLEASYEATVCAAIINAELTGNRTAYLTLVGGGVFGNRIEWITDAGERAFLLHPDAGLDLAFVSYGSSRPEVRELVRRFG